MKHKKLVVISHTSHYEDKDGVIKGWGPTINEINFLGDYWDEIIHIGCLYAISPPESSLSYTKKNIKFVPIPPYGGKTVLAKFLILFKIPKICIQVVKSIKGASEVQLRLPTSMGLFLLPLFTFFISRKFVLWVKYAGNWEVKKAPFSYRIQQFWLKKNWSNCKVTINGFWENQPKHCLSFENPCLSENDLQNGKLLLHDKSFKKPYVLCFIGRLDDLKGVDIIIDSLKKINLNDIQKVHFIGDGNRKEYYINNTSYLGEKALFHGFLDKKRVHEILSKSHFLLLPSKSEGFPKVIAEAACYGVIPIVSNVGSISHYINNSNGFLWDVNSKTPYYTVLENAFNKEQIVLEKISKEIAKLAEKFTFTNYVSRIKTTILNGN